MKTYEGKFMNITEVHDTGKTKIWEVYTKDGFTLAEIKWKGSFRKYCFFPQPDTLYDTACLKEIIEFINDRMNERKS